MSSFAVRELRLMNCVNEVEVRNYPERKVIIVSLYATYTDKDEKEVKQKAKSLGFFGGKPTKLNGSYALKFSKSNNNDSNRDSSLHNLGR